MPDREKVIKALEIFVGIGSCKWSPHRIDESWMELQHLLTDALALLKEQEETINDLTDIIRKLNQHIKDLSEYMTPYGMVKDVKAYAELLKEQEGTIKELQNSYGYLQKQFFEVQDKLLKEQQ